MPVVPVSRLVELTFMMVDRVSVTSRLYHEILSMCLLTQIGNALVLNCEGGDDIAVHVSHHVDAVRSSHCGGDTQRQAFQPNEAR